MGFDVNQQRETVVQNQSEQSESLGTATLSPPAFSLNASPVAPPNDSPIQGKFEEGGADMVTLPSSLQGGHQDGCSCADCMPIQGKFEGGEAETSNLVTIPNQFQGSHQDGCGCVQCMPVQRKEIAETNAPLQMVPGGGENELEQDQDSDEIAVTYTGKDYTTARNAKILTQGSDDDGIATFAATQGQIGEKYPFGETNIPRGCVVELLGTAMSTDRPNRIKEVAQIRIVSVPDGGDQSFSGNTYWTTRTNVSAEANEQGQYTVTDGQATVRTDPEAITGDVYIPSGTTIQITDTLGVDDFPEDIRLQNNAARNSFHKHRYMRLYLLANWTDASGAAKSGWISADDVVGGFANEVLGIAEIDEGVMISNDPMHMTVGVKNTPVLAKGGKRYDNRVDADGNYVLIAVGTYVTILETSGRYIKVSSEDESVSGEWTSSGNIDKSQKKTVGEGSDALVYYKVTDDDARIRDEKQGYTDTGANMALGSFLQIYSIEDGYCEAAKVTKNGEEYTPSEDKHWYNMEYLAPGWSEDIYGKNAAWGKTIIGGVAVAKYRGQREMVNLGGSGGKMKQVSREAYPNLMRMINAATSNTKDDGTADPIGIEINSCFRTYFSQKYFDDNENNPGFNTAATPGWSAHQDSNAFDLNNLSDPAVYTWLKHNAWKYDIIQNVRASNERHHWAYIPGAGKEGVYTTWGTPVDQSW